MEGWEDGRMVTVENGEMRMNERRNVNRGYRQLVVWQDAVEYYVLTCVILKSFSYELRRVVSQQIAAVDSIHRNIAEGYCRRTLREYLQFLNIALGSAGESVSGWHALLSAQQISAADFERADALAYKIENGLIRLIESLQKKCLSGEWDDTFIIRECNSTYQGQTH